MSGLVTGLVLKYSRSRGIARLVAVAIADCCKDDGKGAWPSIPTIAARAGTSVRTAQRSVGKLVHLNECRVTEGAGPHGTNLYEIRIDRLLANKDDAIAAKGVNLTGDNLTGGGNLSAQRCQNRDQEGDRTMSPDPSSDPSKNRPKPVDKSTASRNGARKCTHGGCPPHICLRSKEGYEAQDVENAKTLARVDFNRELEQVEMRAAMAGSTKRREETV
jgi:hypothetical protein